MDHLLGTVCDKYLPSNWTWMASCEDVICVNVAENTNEYATVCHGIANAESGLDRIEKVVRIQNPYLWGCYLLKKEEYASRGIAYRELTLYHNTCPSNAESIAQNNFDWRCSGRRARYGKGVCFASSPGYALDVSTHKRAIIVARVLVGNTAFGSWGQKLPPDGVDTTTSGGTNCKVYVKYSDHEFYPEYLVYF